MASEATVEANKGRSTFRGPTEGRPGSATARGKARRDTCISEETWRLVDKRVSARQEPRYGQVFKRKLRGSVKANIAADQKTEDGRSGGRGGGASEGRPAPYTGGVVLHIGVVQGCSQPHSAARSSYA